MPVIVVARVGLESRSALSDSPDEAERSRPWSHRETACIDAALETTYGEVIEAALESFGTARFGRPSEISFWVEEHDSVGVEGGTFVLPVLRSDHSADWRPWPDVTIGSTIAARDRGLVHGDPLRPYAFVLPPIGNGAVPGWQDLLHMLEVLRSVVEVLVLPGGVAATFALLRHRAAGAVEAVRTQSGNWSERGLDPYALDEYLDEHPWHVQDLAAALACTESEAEAILWALGFARARSGLWRRGETPEAMTLSRIRRLLISGASQLETDSQLRAELHQRLEYLVEHGTPPEEPDWGELP